MYLQAPPPVTLLQQPTPGPGPAFELNNVADQQVNKAKIEEEEFAELLKRLKGLSWTDVPALITPWIFLSAVLLPTALLDVSTLGVLTLISTLIMSTGFMFLSRGTAWRMLAVVCGAACIMGYSLGCYDRYKYLGQLSFYQKASAYYNVMPSVHTGSLQDASFVSFSADASVDITRGVGYVSGQKYCAAPITSAQTFSSSEFVNFWAVGTGCCASRGLFQCGDVGNTSLHSGLVLKNVVAALNPEYDNYMDAVHMAVDTYDIQTPEEPMLIIWGMEPSQMISQLRGNASSFCLITILTFLLTVPVFVFSTRSLGFTLMGLPISKQWNPRELLYMTFGFDTENVEYPEYVAQGLFQGRCYWTGEVQQDFLFWICNKSMFLGIFFCHPEHPFAKWERLVVLGLVSVLMLFAFTAITLGLGQGVTRSLILASCVTIPKSVIFGLLKGVMEQDFKDEMEGGPGAASASSASFMFELFILSMLAAVTVMVCWVSSLWIAAGGTSIGSALWSNVDTLGFAVVMEILWALIWPGVGKNEFAGKMQIGFFGRWAQEAALREQEEKDLTLADLDRFAA